MKTLAIGSIVFALLLASGSASNALSQSAIGKEWSKSGFGTNVRYQCKQTSCGGPNNVMMVERFGGIGAVPELGIPSGSNVEAEFRRRPDVRRIFAAVLKQLIKEGPIKGSSFKSTYFANADYVGYNFSSYEPGKKVYVVGQMRISDNAAVMIGGAAETAERARKNLNTILPTIKTD